MEQSNGARAQWGDAAEGVTGSTAGCARAIQCLCIGVLHVSGRIFFTLCSAANVDGPPEAVRRVL